MDTVGVALGAMGVTEFDGADSRLSPIAFFARTVKVYVVPFERPVTATLVAAGPVSAVIPPGVDVAT